jgi:hypothetical protein
MVQQWEYYFTFPDITSCETSILKKRKRNLKERFGVQRERRR